MSNKSDFVTVWWKYNEVNHTWYWHHTDEGFTDGRTPKGETGKWTKEFCLAEPCLAEPREGYGTPFNDAIAAEHELAQKEYNKC